jgi:murein DD-endopeptidase MepM/ murein hydrolase activator NlpD
MSGNYRITVEEREYSLQVFAGDTLYTPVPDWNDTRRLSTTEAGPLADALWREAYKVSGSTYQPDSPAHQLALQEKLGTPLSGVYQVDFEGNSISLQVFAYDTVFTDPQGRFVRQHDLARPEKYEPATIPADTGSPEDAVSSKRPTFAMLPIAGQPRLSQLYGYTKWSAGGGRQYYTATQGRHPGIDFAVPVGTPMVAIAYGLVVWAGTGSPFASGPRSIVVRYGSIYAIYGHAHSEAVSRGQFVSPGQLVGYSGTLGGPHLHFELREVPARVLQNQDPNQPPVSPGFTFNPIEVFSPDMVAYFESWYHKLGGDSHFCRGSFSDQERITFGGPVDTRPCG